MIAIEELRKATQHLRNAMNEVDNETGKELLEAHQMITRVRSKIEQEQDTEKFQRILGMSR